MKWTGIVLCGGCRPCPGAAQISEPPPVGGGRGSVQAVGGCPRAGTWGQVEGVVWGAVSVWRATGATAWPVQSSKGSKSKDRGAPWLLPVNSSRSAALGSGGLTALPSGDWGWCSC